MSERHLTVVTAFEAMCRFLDRYAKMTNSEDVQELVLSLSHMPPDEGGIPTTLTPGYWEDWLDAIDEVVSSNGVSED